VELRLFDGTSNNIISEVVSLPVKFPSGECMTLNFYVTPLDSCCSLVLGHSWLTRYNPLIDWVSGSISFRPPSVLQNPASVPSIETLVNPPFSPVENPLQFTPSEILLSNSKQPHIGIISAPALLWASHLSGSKTFSLQFCSTLQAKSTTISEKIDLSAIPEEYHEYADVFSKSKAETLTPHHPYNLQINLEKDSYPLVGTIYSLSKFEQEALKEFINENLTNRFIRSTSSSHGAPVLFMKKKDSSLWLCIDFCGLNKITKKDQYPLPLISDLLDSPCKAHIYTKIDLWHMYHLVRIAEEDKWKTAFRTCYGAFEWLVMPFGLTNAPASFQRFMNNLFSDLLDVCVVVYLDDILIYSDDIMQHREHVKEVLKRLQKAGLYVKAEKCEFHSDSIEYLGYVLSPSGLTMSDAKVKTIQEWPEPKKVKDIQFFLGFANFYRCFIFNYSDIVIPLTHLTRKDASWNFDENCRKAFNTLKQAFTSAPILMHWVPDAQLVMETDASDYALAAILSILTKNNEIHPVAFHSRMFSAPELNYDVYDKELLAIFEAFKIWRHYLEGSALPIDVVIDHKNLEYFLTTKVLTRRQARWSEYLSQFNLVICFCPGRLGTKLDTLTR